ncbi:MAG: hypothetical protein KAS63_07685 [Candidatus Heimdallarchaeota archaeon]|nr:hypothetical protein [Candidatus Heimdallarchaeota archaeon]MCK4955230.1 hypothetical protein [Candidatus Heimdallarchaeota archaeon]
MVTIIPPIISMLGSVAVLGIILGIIFWGIRKLNKVIAGRRIRRKLAAASMAGEQLK